MSWQLASAAVLLAGLAGGVAWYERGRPDARIVALVATLAALAALGRIAFAALPNVKPSTDIVLVSGYALGAAPGFMVGALCGLTSNFFFGQGPWTPWQMAAWAATGGAGAALAVLTRGRISRWPLAAVCAVAGFLFAAVQDVGDWVNFSDHGLRSLEVYVGKGLVFDAVHATGCLLFALVFGPALLRSLRRFTRRLEISWLSPGGAVVPVAVAVVAAALLVPAHASASDTSGAIAYLREAENADGGLGAGPREASQPIFSGWAALGLAAAGVDPAAVRHGGASLLAYIAGHAGGDVGSIERTILVAAASGADPSAFGGVDLLAVLRRHISADGSVSRQTNLTEFAILALRAAGAAVSAQTLGWLERQQNGDGGFGFGTAGGASDPDDTGAALEALTAAGGSPRAMARAAAYLGGVQNGDGGFPAEAGGPSDAQSTAWAIQGLIAAGADPGGVARALAYLRRLEAADGHVRYAGGEDQTPVWVTGEALMALARRPLPLPAVPRGRSGAPAPRAAGSEHAQGARSHTTAARRSAAVSSSSGAAAGRAASATPGLAHTAPGRLDSLRGRGFALSLAELVGSDETAILSALERLLAPVGLSGPPTP